MLRRLFLFLFLAIIIVPVGYAQTDSVSASVRPAPRYSYRAADSAARARRIEIRDSLKAVGDSIARIWIKAPDPNRPNQFLDSLIKLYKVENLDFKAWAAKFSQKKNRFDEGKSRPKGETWVISVILFLVLFFALIRFFFTRELSSIVQSFYSNQTLSQINKEDNLFSSWPFIFFYLLFGLIIGMFLYLTGKYLNLEYQISGFNLFLALSGIVICLFTAKIIVLRLLGFLFDVRKLVREYVSILYLSYFNAALVFLPLVIAYSLTPARYSHIFGYLGALFFIGIFIIQFIRAGTNILSAYKFPKVYLIIYLCALEFCPILILLKALRF